MSSKYGLSNAKISVLVLVIKMKKIGISISQKILIIRALDEIITHFARLQFSS